jgi:phosphate-selective porin OprO and OprP
MAKDSWVGRCGRGAAIAFSVTVLPTVSNAQGLSIERIETVERAVRELRTELQQVKTELGETKRQLRESKGETQRAQQELRQAREAAARARHDALSAADAEAQAKQAATEARAAAVAPPPPPPPPPAPHVVQRGLNRFGLESADKRNSIFLTGRLHFDVGDYLDYTPQSRKFASVQNLNSGVNARRARIGVTGKFAEDWTYSLIYDFGGSTDASPGANSSGIQTAQITYNGFNNNKSLLPLAFDIGYMDTPFTLEEATSSNDILFLERASVQAVASNIFANDFRSALGARSNDERYWAGTYMTGPQSGAVHTAGEQYGAFGRATYQILQDPAYTLHVGADIGALLKPPAPAGIRTITLSDRPELRIDPTAILSTGALGTAANPVDGAQVYGAELAASYENFFLQGEYYHIDVDRARLPTNTFDGAYIEASWILTGE